MVRYTNACAKVVLVLVVSLDEVELHDYMVIGCIGGTRSALVHVRTFVV